IGVGINLTFFPQLTLIKFGSNYYDKKIVQVYKNKNKTNKIIFLIEDQNFKNEIISKMKKTFYEEGYFENIPTKYYDIESSITSDDIKKIPYKALVDGIVSTRNSTVENFMKSKRVYWFNSILELLIIRNSLEKSLNEKQKFKYQKVIKDLVAIQNDMPKADFLIIDEKYKNKINSFYFNIENASEKIVFINETNFKKIIIKILNNYKKNN
ncbi:MAG: hypothetical protein K4H23_04580, partial [Mollicutes bacterium PWAP]|nr:hypothetical protein [Mollicutes bacterium PWAP]